MVTARVLNALHFSVAAPRSGGRRETQSSARASEPAAPGSNSPGTASIPACEIRDAFVYDWRLWSIAEVRDAMEEAGFASVEVHDRLGDAVDSEGNLYPRALEPGEELDENWVVYAVARR
jgi:hypothetical protein